MRVRYASALFAATVLVVLGIIVLTWRPWDDGAQARITASGLVPVLTLLLGQLGSWAISSASTEQAVTVRRAELDHDANQSEKAAERERSGQEAAAKSVADAQVRVRFIEAIRTMADLAAALAVQNRSNHPTLPAAEAAAARVALLQLIPLTAEDTWPQTSVKSVLAGLETLYEARSSTDFVNGSTELLAEIRLADHDIAQSDHLG